MIVKLVDIFNLQMGKTPARNNKAYWNDGEYDWISISDLENYKKYISSTKEKITELAIKESGIKQVPSNTLLMSFKLSVGKTAITKYEVYTNEAIMAFIPNHKYDVYIDYFYYLFSWKDWSNDTSRAVMGATLNKSTLGQIMVKIPPLDEQCKIAKTLDKVSDLIAKRKQQLEKLDLLVKSKFVEMFGDPMNNPYGWSKSKLGNNCKIVTGNTPSRIDIENYGAYIEWIKSDNINTPHTYITRAQECLSEKGFEKSRFVDKNSILMTCIAGSINCIGNVAITDRRVAFNQQINAIIPVYDNVFYLYWLFIMLKPYIQSSINMSLKCILSKGQLSDMEFMFPPIELQSQFADFVKQTEHTKTIINQSLEKLETLKKALMQEYFG